MSDTGVAVDREALERAARINYESLGYPESWDDLTESMRDLFCRRIQSAIDLVTPIFLDAEAVRREAKAKAWKEGYHERGMDERNGNFTSNPYRSGGAS